MQDYDIKLELGKGTLTWSNKSHAQKIKNILKIFDLSTNRFKLQFFQTCRDSELYWSNISDFQHTLR